AGITNTGKGRHRYCTPSVSTVGARTVKSGVCSSRRAPVVCSAYANLIGPRLHRTVRCRGNLSSLRARSETRLVRLLRIIKPGLPPEVVGDRNRIDTGRPPPGPLVAGAMDRAVMRAAERDGEFVARLAAERAVAGSEDDADRIVCARR